ncbi:copper transport protein [Pullulanibacillus pueri]|uniref:Copper resistance protein CopC n=1 Tax=Pullulanibacillus pueri TaxID=1437324 RepID=A0A8J3ENB5_9BACL|nr:copper resistance protein CopC [Pullulanibacillus pueri]MBM7680524.1 copper transport protein [Pullulanibacillus pueri]GGH86112.1 hypothetical protein GCM10007096_33060 [Pullulanibacillus pueri]
MTINKKIFGFIIILLCFVFSQQASAHAVLLEATPGENAHLQKAPEEIRLTFNERLQDELYYIKVYDQESHQVSKKTTKLSINHKELSVKLPLLSQGTYTVVYHVISADSHPVEASYHFTVGQASASGQAAPSITNEHQHGGLQSYLLNGFYYFFFLAILGWLLIGIIRPLSIKEQRRSWFMSLSYFFSFVCILLSLSELLASTSGIDSRQLTDFFLHTSTGIVAGLRVILAILGLFLLQRNRWLDSLWFIAFLFIESYSGHAVTFSPAPLTVVLDALHLIAAAFWVGGLIYIVSHIRVNKKSLEGFLPFFSKGAFISIIVLILTGIVSTLLFLPHISAIIESSWGKLLMLKVIIVLLVVIIASIVRKRINMSHFSSFSKWFAVDLIMMLSIVFIVGFLTHMSPFPSNEPLDWQATKHHFSVDLTLAPKNPGVENTFELTVTDPHQEIQEVHLVVKDVQNGTPLEIPLKTASHTKQATNPLAYQASGPYLPHSGKYEIEVQILNQHDDYTVLNKTITVFKIK